VTSLSTETTEASPAAPPAVAPPSAPPKRKRHWGRWVAAVVVAAAVATGAIVIVNRDSDADEPTPSDSSGGTTANDTAAVERRDLVQTEEVDGALGYGDRTTLSGAGLGTITGLPAVGSVIDRGQQLWEIDGHAGPQLFFGDRPMWRRLDNSVDDGPDVRILEENLVALGYATPDQLTVDDEFTSATADAVERWQEALGLEEDGVVELGEVVVAAGPVRVAERKVSTGAKDEGEVLSVSGTARLVHVDLDTALADLVHQGDAVEVELPDGTTAPGTVWSVGTVATADADTGETTIEVEIALASDPGGYEDAPVTVDLTRSRADGVLAVPVAALLALAEGGYAVERQTAAGGTELVAVELGAFADGWVEVTGDLSEGDQIVVPA
jgi:peptidoglycan hydrolase-like protein with peptidoglycan-binding domain